MVRDSCSKIYSCHEILLQLGELKSNGYCKSIRWEENDQNLKKKNVLLWLFLTELAESMASWLSLVLYLIIPSVIIMMVTRTMSLSWLNWTLIFLCRFVGGEMNTCYNCLDRHIENGRGKRIALIYDSPLNGKVEMYTYENLQRLVSIRLRVMLRLFSSLNWDEPI